MYQKDPNQTQRLHTQRHSERTTLLSYILNCALKTDTEYEKAGLPWWLSGKESACRAADSGLISGSGRSPGEGNSYPLQYSCLGNPMDRGAWRASPWGHKRVRHNLATKQQQE